MNLTDKFYAEIETLKNHFDGIDGKREWAYVTARELRRDSVQAVRDIHRGRFEEARALIAKGRDAAVELAALESKFGFAEEAQQEYAEAALTLAFISGQEPPSREEIGTTERGYLLGMADVIGELRRHILDLLRKDRIEESIAFMDLMDDLQGILMKFDHTDAVLPMRRKQDQFRPIIERTRGDLTNIICQKKLEQRLRDNEAAK